MIGRRPILLAAAAATVLACGSASADQIQISKGRLIRNGPWATQPIGAKNESAKQVEWLSVECGFFQEGRLVATGLNNTRNIKPGESAFFDVSANHAEGTDRAECRVKVAE